MWLHISLIFFNFLKKTLCYFSKNHFKLFQKKWKLWNKQIKSKKKNPNKKYKIEREARAHRWNWGTGLKISLIKIKIDYDQNMFKLCARACKHCLWFTYHVLIFNQSAHSHPSIHISVHQSVHTLSLYHTSINQNQLFR